MKSSKPFKSLFFKFFLSLLVVSLIPVAANIFQLWQAQDTIKQAVERNLVNNAKLLVSEVNHWSDLNLRSSTIIAKTSQVRSMLPSFQVPALKSLQETFDWTYVAFTTDLQGNGISRSDRQVLKSHRGRDYITAILSGQEAGQEVLISPENKKPALCLSVPITKKQALIGTLVQCSNLTDISENVTAARIGKTGYARLIDNKQQLIAHGDSSKLSGSLQDLSADPITLIKDFNIPAISTAGGKKIVSYSLSSNLNWRLTVVQDYDEAYAVLSETKRNAIIAGILLLLGLFLIAYILGNSITKPIKKLANAAETFSKGEMEQNIPGTARGDEIGELAKAVERLGQGTRVMMERYRKLKDKSDR